MKTKTLIHLGGGHRVSPMLIGACLSEQQEVSVL